MNALKIDCKIKTIEENLYNEAFVAKILEGKTVEIDLKDLWNDQKPMYLYKADI